jgi:hypothetical protein
MRMLCEMHDHLYYVNERHVPGTGAGLAVPTLMSIIPKFICVNAVSITSFLYLFLFLLYMNMKVLSVYLAHVRGWRCPGTAPCCSPPPHTDSSCSSSHSRRTSCSLQGTQSRGHRERESVNESHSDRTSCAPQRTEMEGGRRGGVACTYEMNRSTLREGERAGGRRGCVEECHDMYADIMYISCRNSMSID